MLMATKRLNAEKGQSESPKGSQECGDAKGCTSKRAIACPVSVKAR